MTTYRITKYDPSNRDAQGRYLADDWASVSDICNTFNGVPLTISDYLAAEDLYVKGVASFMTSQSLETLKVTELESYGDCRRLPSQLRKECEEHLEIASEGRLLRIDDVCWAVRLILKEVFWCRLVGHNNCRVHFGYDYYMYFECQEQATSKWSVPAGMYVEECLPRHE